MELWRVLIRARVRSDLRVAVNKMVPKLARVIHFTNFKNISKMCKRSCWNGSLIRVYKIQTDAHRAVRGINNRYVASLTNKSEYFRYSLCSHLGRCSIGKVFVKLISQGYCRFRWGAA